MSRESIAHCSPVDDVVLFESHHNAIIVFPGISVSYWTMVFNTWNKTRDYEDAVSREDVADNARTAQTPRLPVKGEQINLDMMELDTINLE